MRPPAPWTILDVELGEALVDIQRPAGVGAIVLRFRLDGAVVGTSYQLPEAFPMAAAEVARLGADGAGLAVAALLAIGEGRVPAKRWQNVEGAISAIVEPDALNRLSRLIARRRAREVTVSGTIVVCTRGRPDQLRECLASIAAETAAGRETIVVDNGPDPATKAVVAAQPAVRYVAEPRPGLSRARNAGVAAASGDVVVFVDDDVRPEPGWVDPLLRAFDADDIDVVCGLVLPDAFDSDAQIGFEHDLGFGGMGFLPLIFDEEFRAGRDEDFRTYLRHGRGTAEMGASANLAVRRRRVIELGGFDVRIGPGAAGGCGDVREYWHRVLSAGGRIAYEPLSIVRHQHRRDFDALRRHASDYAFGATVANFVQFARGRNRIDLVRAFVHTPAWFAWRAAASPWRWWFGKPDRLLGAWIEGYLKALLHVGMIFTRREAGLEWPDRDEPRGGVDDPCPRPG